MAGKYAKVKPGQPLAGSFSAGLYNDAAEFFGPNAGFNADRPLSANPQGVVVKIKNTTSSDRLRWDCMSLGDLRFDIVTGKESIIYDAEEAATDKTPAILQEPIAAGKFGDALIFGYTLAKIATAGSTAELRATPDDTNHNLLPGTSGPVQLLAAPSDSADTIRPVLVGAAATMQTGIAKTPSGGISGRTGSGTIGTPWTWGQADCTVVGVDGKETAETLTIYNMVEADIEGDKVIQWKQIGGKPFVDVEDCRNGSWLS